MKLPELQVGDTVRPLTGGSLMMVEGFEPEPCEFEGRTYEKGLVKCVVIYTDGRKDSEKERCAYPRVYLDKRERKAQEAM